RGCTSASPWRNTPSRAIAKYIRGPVRASPFAALKMETKITSVTSFAAAGPNSRCITSAATRSVAQNKSSHRQREDCSDLEGGAPVLHGRRVPHSPDVDGRDGGDHGYAGELVGDRRERDQLTQVVRERHRERRRRARVDRQEQGPAEQERGQTPKRLTHVD